MLMPFSSAFTVNNLGIPIEKLPLIYLVTGMCSIVAGPLVGRLSDSIGKYPVFCLGTTLSIIMVTIYCHLGVTPLWAVMLVSVILFIGISARMVSVSALISAVPDLKDRGAFMSVNSSLQQFAGGVAAGIAGLIVVQTESGKMSHYDLLGYVVITAMAITVALMYSIHKMVKEKDHSGPAASVARGPDLNPPLPGQRLTTTEG
jgi:predicted MFS family arabinose efflux permease